MRCTCNSINDSTSRTTDPRLPGGIHQHVDVVLRKVRHQTLLPPVQIKLVRCLVCFHGPLVLPNAYKRMRGHVQQVTVLWRCSDEALCALEAPCCCIWWYWRVRIAGGFSRGAAFCYVYV